jgi:hypothetical protein
VELTQVERYLRKHGSFYSLYGDYREFLFETVVERLAAAAGGKAQARERLSAAVHAWAKATQQEADR